MTKYLMLLVALFALVGCTWDDDNDLTDNDPVDENSPSDTDTEQPDVDTAPPWVTDQTSAGLEWSPLTEEKMYFYLAKRYCHTMGGRLPNINELRKIIINCPGSTYGGACRVSDPDHLSVVDWTESCGCNGTAETYSALGDGKDVILWSSSSRDDWNPLEPIRQAWIVEFNEGYLNVGQTAESDYNNRDKCHARCVR